MGVHSNNIYFNCKGNKLEWINIKLNSILFKKKLEYRVRLNLF